MKNTNANEIIESIKTAFATANSAYVSRNPEKGEALKGNMQDDIKAGLAVFLEFSPAQVSQLGKLGVSWANVGQGLGAATNVKVARRLPQFLGFAITGDGRYLKGSTKTAILEYCALCIGAKTKDALRFASTGKGDENTSDVINVAKARALRDAFGAVKASSRDTQASVSFSKGGLLHLLGLVEPWAKGDTMPAPVDCKLARTLNALINGATQGQIELWAQQASAKGKK